MNKISIPSIATVPTHTRFLLPFLYSPHIHPNVVATLHISVIVAGSSITDNSCLMPRNVKNALRLGLITTC
jgi:hypothetical protein